MNKKLIAVMLLVLLVLIAGCKGKNNEEATIPAETAQATEVTDAPTETLHPALEENPFSDEVEETNAATEAPEETTDETESEETKAPTEAPTEPEKETQSPTEATEDDGVMTYEEFMALSAAEQQAFMDSFDSIEDFFAWYNAAKAEYDAGKDEIDVGDGSFDLGDLIGNN